MKKAVSLLLLAAMIMSLGACKNKDVPKDDIDKDTSDNTVSTNINIIESGVEPQNFERDFNIYTSNFYDCVNWIYSDTNDGEIMAMQLYRGIGNAEEKLGVDIDVMVDNNGPYSAKNTFHSLMMAGDTDYQLYYGHDTCTVTNAIQGDFLNIRKLEDYIDMSKPWWKGTSEQFTIDGKLLFTSTCLDLSSIFLNYLLVYNKELADVNNIEIPYDDVIAGEWYMDDLIALTTGLKRDLNGDTVVDENDQFGITTSKYPMMGLQSGLGGGMLINNNGVIELNTDVDRMSALLEKWEKLMLNGDNKLGETNGGGAELFINGQSVFMLGEARNLYTTVRQANVTFGILPVPKFDETQENYASAGCALYWAIPVTFLDEDLEFIGSVIQEMSAYNYNYTVPAVWETILGGKLSDSDEDAAMFEIIRGSQYVDLGFAFSAQSKQLEEMVFMLENTSSDKVASYMEIRKSSANSTVEMLNKMFEELEG